MEQDLEYFQPSTNSVSEDTELTKKLLSKVSKEVGVYGTMPLRTEEVDASIPFLNHTIVEQRSIQINGIAEDVNFHRRPYRRNGGKQKSIFKTNKQANTFLYSKFILTK